MGLAVAAREGRRGGGAASQQAVERGGRSSSSGSGAVACWLTDRLTCACGEVWEDEGEGADEEAGQLVDDADLLKDDACGGRKGGKEGGAAGREVGR